MTKLQMEETVQRLKFARKNYGPESPMGKLISSRLKTLEARLKEMK